MNKKIKLGVIGIGFAWDRLHYPAIKELSDKYEIVAICNKTIDKAQGFAKGINLSSENIYSDYKELLKRTDIDAIDLLVPISENYEVAKDILKSGKHLIAEKPFASTPEAAKELIDLKNQYNVKVLVAENFRYDEPNTIIKDIVNSGEIGEVVYFIYNAASDFKEDMISDSFAAKEWRQHPLFPGGIFLDGGIHHIALMRFLFGDVSSVHAFGRPQQEEYCPYMAISSLLKFKNNVFGSYSYYTENKELQKPPIGLRIFGTLGDIYLQDTTCGTVNINYKNGPPTQKTFTPERGYYNELVNFYNALTSNEPIVATPEKELGDIDLIFKILNCIDK